MSNVGVTVFAWDIVTPQISPLTPETLSHPLHPVSCDSGACGVAVIVTESPWWYTVVGSQLPDGPALSEHCTTPVPVPLGLTVRVIGSNTMLSWTVASPT